MVNRTRDAVVMTASVEGGSAAAKAAASPMVEKILERIEAIDHDLGELEQLVADDALYQPAKPLYHEPSDLPQYTQVLQRHETFKPRLKAFLVGRIAARAVEIERTKREFVNCLSVWKQRIRQIEAMNGEKDDDAASISSRGTAVGGASAATGSTGDAVSFGAAAGSRASAGAHTGTSPTSNSVYAVSSGGRSGRRSGALSDAVRSEEELNQVLLDLLEQERKNPATHWMSTLAIVPPMNAANSKFLCEIPFISGNCAVDPEEYTKAANLEHRREESSAWSEEERGIFVEKHLLFPKDFRKISSYLPFKSANDCVLFYYRNKKSLRLKQQWLNYRKNNSTDSINAKPKTAKRPNSSSNQTGASSAAFSSSTAMALAKQAKKSRPVGRPRSAQSQANSTAGKSGSYNFVQPSSASATLSSAALAASGSSPPSTARSSVLLPTLESASSSPPPSRPAQGTSSTANNSATSNVNLVHVQPFRPSRIRDLLE